MRTKIESIKDLREEYARLHSISLKQEKAMIEDVNISLEKLRPANMVINLANNLFTEKKNTSIVSKGIDLGLHLLSNKLISQKSPGYAKHVLSFVAKNIGARFLNRETTTEKVTRMLFDTDYAGTQKEKPLTTIHHAGTFSQQYCRN